MIRLLVWPVGWILGFVLLQASLMAHQNHWITEHGGLPMTEEGMMEFGDAPNVTVGWIVTGWISLAVGGFVSRSLRREPLE